MRPPSESGARIKVSGGPTTDGGPKASRPVQLFYSTNENPSVHNVLYGASIPTTVIRAETRCASCGAVLAGKGTTVFLCPSCGKTRIGRCGRCRDQSVAYRCPTCSFVGP
ncbi:MAG: DUF1610 domain-containing protein [Methanobacteriota archaeon]|nr:MAG: DUF1610 domain-containing protein [Euryarchaeota archaeon]TLZ67021.1 MAG: DUF1610 domain-containing protein [Euryarchaeota archaeon]